MVHLRLAYRALESTNTKTRRLAYLTAIISMLGHDSLGERLLLSKLVRWSQEHKHHLASYFVQTGEVTSTRRNSAGARYLRLATNLGLIAFVSGVYRATRTGLMLFALNADHGDNPFFLTEVEKLFYTYVLLEKDADILLTITDDLLQHHGISLVQIQRTFQENFLSRLSSKSELIRDSKLKQYLLERRTEVGEWKNPRRYAEHIVPPRLNWLLDLGFLEPEQFRQHRYFLTEAGRRFLEALPQPGNQFSDVSDEWLALDFWLSAAGGLLNIEPLAEWNQIDEVSRQKICAQLLRETFKAFQHTVVPKVSLTQALLYLSVKLILEYRIGAAPEHLREWLSSPKTLDGHRYEIRFSHQENASYLIATPV